ncbi:MAG: type 1 glutamine amidotransferase, partial [Burkholderiaceae bacterium]
FERYLNEKGMPRTTVNTFAREALPNSAAAYSGICSLGGAMSANDDLPWIESELALMRDADTRGVPVIGHCLGGQLLAKAFGAPVTVNAMKEIGWGEVEVDDPDRARDWVGDGRTFELFQWHGDTFEIPREGRRFLTNELCANQAFVIERDGFAHLGMQFHVEMTPQLVRAWATDDEGIEEIGAALERQSGVGVQRSDEMLRDVQQRTQRMHLTADRIYGRWISGVQR